MKNMVLNRPMALALLILLWAWIGIAAARSQPQTLADQLELMATEQGFELYGLEQIEPEAPAAEVDEGTVTQRIRALLRGYDHVIVHKPQGEIGRLMILGEKRAAPPPPLLDEDEENVLPTRRKGEHHLVSATLSGPGSETMEIELMVDTGASLVVLPTSAATRLGLDPEQLESHELQTAKGKMTARIGRLGSIELGSARLDDIEAAFVADEQLGENALLGMNVLGRYVFILDDENNRLTLIPEAKGGD